MFDIEERIKVHKEIMRKEGRDDIARNYKRTDMAPGPVKVYTKREIERYIKERLT